MEENARRKALEASSHSNRFVSTGSQPNGMATAALPYAQTMPSPEINFADFHHPSWDPAAANLTVSYPTPVPVVPSGWNGQSPSMVPSSQMAFHQAMQTPNPWASFYPTSQLPEQTQTGFQPNNDLPQTAQENCSSSNNPSNSGFEEPISLAMGDLTFSSSPLGSSNASPDQHLEPQTNGGTLKGKEAAWTMVGHGNLVNHMSPTTVYSIPADYATAENPMTLQGLEQLQQSAQLYSHQVPHYAPGGIIGSAAPPAEPTNPPKNIHECACGPNCQCMACPVHPYNRAMMERMARLSTLMASSHLDNGAGSRPHQSWSGVPSPNTAIGSEGDSGNWDDTTRATEGIDPRQVMMKGSSNNYFTVKYTFPGSGANTCSYGNGACRCADNCNCVGCRAHTGHIL